MVTKVDIRLYITLNATYCSAAMCRNSLLQDIFYVYSFLWGHTSQSSSRNIPLARSSIYFPSHQTADYCKLMECGAVCWILQRKISFLKVHLSYLSQLHLQSKKSFRTILFFSLKMLWLWEVMIQSKRPRIGWRCYFVYEINCIFSKRVFNIDSY